jgi:antitoxin CcdA
MATDMEQRVARAASALLARQEAAVYDASRPKRATNVSVNVDLLDKARELGVNLSQTLEDALKARLREERRRKWLEDNREAIEEYNRHYEKYGLWSDGLRMF